MFPMHFLFKTLPPGASCTYRCVNPQARGLCFSYDLHNYNDTQAVGKAGVNDNQDIVPDNLVILLSCLTEHNPQSIHLFFPK